MKLFSFLGQALSDGENPSAMRVLMIAGCTAIFLVWTVVGLQSATVPEFPQSVIEVLGALILGKVAEKHIENRNPPAPPAV